jgi:hypothetical protein
MSKKGNKTGLAGRMRAVMQESWKPFTPVQIAEALGVPPGPGREAVTRVLGDFYRRGEVVRAGRSGRGYLYRYNHEYRRRERPADLKRKVLWAIRYAGMKGAFTTAAVLFRAGDDVSKNYIHKILKSLEEAGFVEKVCEKKRELSHGLENVYRVIDHDRFRRELL